MRSASNVSASKNRIALNTKEQCDLLESHGVEFKLCSKAEAESFLRNNTYFFKIKAFDKNFKRDQQGNYSKLDFAYLKDISTIDFKLRMLILRMTGDIEHALRIRFNNLISRVQEDGYQVIADYEKDQNLYYAKHGRSFVPEDDYKKSVYTEGMINKYLDQKPVWLFWETCTLNSLIRCYSSFLEHRKFYDMTYSLLYGVRLLRNAASHHNCLLIPPAATIKKTKVLDSLMPIFLATDNPVREKTLYLAQSDPLIHDLSCILLSHINLVKSAGMRRYTDDQAASVLRRIDEHAAWYKDPQSGCDYLLDQFAAIKLLLSEYIKFNKQYDSGKLSETQLELKTEPTRKPVRHGRRRPSKKAGNQATSV